MEIKFNIDISSMQKEHEAIMMTKMRNAVQERTNSFFCETQSSQYDKAGYKYVTTKVPGDGLKAIDDEIANRFLDPKFQESMQKFFDYNWERIFEKCMTRALQHKANGIAFNKLHDLPPMKETK